MSVINKVFKFVPGIAVGIAITLIASITFFLFQERHAEERYRKEYSLAWTVKNTATSYNVSFLKLFNISHKNYLTKEIQVINAGNRPLHNVYVKILFKKKIVMHSSCENDPLPFYDRDNKVVTDPEAFKGKDAFDIRFNYFPPQSTRPILVSLEQEIKAGTEELALRQDPLMDIGGISISSEEVNGTPLKAGANKAE
ncbi:MAG: hypothetical protein WC980_00250 [Candidatus Brocadiia bacterium]